MPHQLTHRFLPPLPQPVSQPTPIVCHLSLHQVFLSRLARPPLRVSRASSTPQCLFSPLGPILPAIRFLYLPNSSTLQYQMPLPFVYQYPLVSKCTNGELGYKTTTTPTSVTSQSMVGQSVTWQPPFPHLLSKIMARLWRTRSAVQAPLAVLSQPTLYVRS